MGKEERGGDLNLQQVYNAEWIMMSVGPSGAYLSFA